jgi:hypothetical protein
VLEPWWREHSSGGGGLGHSRLPEEAENKSLISLPLFGRSDYIFIVI